MNKLFFIITVFLIFSMDLANARENNEALADFIYNLADYVHWSKKDSIKICSYGNDNISDNLAKIDVIRDRLSNIGNVKIITNVEFESINMCNILYIAQNKEKDLLKITSKTNGRPILTVSSITNFTGYNGIMEFKLSRGKIKLQVNEESLSKAGLKISPTVLIAAGNKQDRS
jgi:hypothetical protein